MCTCVQTSRRHMLELWFYVGKLLYHIYHFLTKPYPNFGGQRSFERDKVYVLRTSEPIPKQPLPSSSLWGFSIGLFLFVTENICA